MLKKIKKFLGICAFLSIIFDLLYIFWDITDNDAEDDDDDDPDDIENDPTVFNYR